MKIHASGEDYLETILEGKRKKTPEQLRQMDRGQLEQYVADLAAFLLSANRVQGKAEAVRLPPRVCKPQGMA